MKTVIIAPHPDDEWIGCGCTMLKKINNKENVLVLIITKQKRKTRIRISKKFAKKYKYKINFLGEPEKKIDETRLIVFLKKNISRKDILYLPDCIKIIKK